MANAVAKQESNHPATLRTKLTAMAPEFKKALPGHIPVDRFIRTVQTAIQLNPQIAKAATATEGGMQSLFAACTKAATDGLILDGREAALVTFRQNVKERKNDPDKYEERIQYLPMVAGLMKKARNSGVIANIGAHVVYEKDHFEYELGDDEKIVHRPAFGERGKPIAVYAIVRLKDGSIQREVMDRAAVMRIASQAKNAKQYSPEDGKNFGEWWRKTVIRRISKYLPSSSDRDEFMQAVSRIDDDFDFEATNGGETVPVERPAGIAGPKKRGGAAAILKDVTPKQEPVEQDNAPDDMDDAAQFYAEHEQDQGFDYDRQTGEIIEPEQPKQQRQASSQRQASNQRQQRQPRQQANEDSRPQPGDDI